MREALDLDLTGFPSLVSTGAELRQQRRGLGLTQAELGDALGLSGAFIGEMEREEKAVERRTALSLWYFLALRWIERHA